MGLSQENIALLENYFKNKPVLKAYVFGSFARGENDQNSDIDLLLELDYSRKIGLGFVQMQIELEELLNQKVDLVSLNGLSPFIKPVVDKEKMLIYAR